MSDLPTGTVTFLFTDIEGSTKLWQQFPNAMPNALARHHEILQRAIESHNGYVFQIIGDAFCAAFATAFDGLDAALNAQRALRDYAWGETGAIRVRMALHTGAAEVRAGEFTSGEYVSGITLSRAARLLSAGHGGQILLSAPATELVREQLSQNIALRDMGARRLKDLVQPQQIYQVLANDLPQDFPALKTLDALPNNLPIQLTSFVGREKEIREIKGMVGRVRLVTLTGAGGSGKTRLSLQVAADVIDEFEKGAWFVELAPISDASLVPNAVMTALELREEAGRAPLDALTDFLRAKKLLLILDNCEHLVEACARLAHHLLTHCPDLKILASSREGLGVAGEVTYQVPVLGLPDPKHLPSLEILSQFDAVKLFIERATAVQPNFQVTNANAPAVAQICFRLDGIPLALELAAARIKLFSPEQIAARLDDRLRLLTGGSRTVMPRQQTLRAAIDWSFSLLSEQERILFRRLSVFVGGWTFEAAENVCAGDGLDALDILELLSQLVTKSLVITEMRDDETRYRMLETIREYAFEKLRDAGEVETLRDKHLDYFVAFAERAEPQLKRAQQEEWLARLDEDVDNFRAALEWSGSEGRVQKGLRLGGALFRFWDLHGSNWKEGVHHLERLVQHPEAASPTLLRAQALFAAAVMQTFLGDFNSANKKLKETIEIARVYGEQGKHLLSEALTWHSDSDFFDDLARGEAMVDEAYEIARALNDDWLIAVSLFIKGHKFTRTNRQDHKTGRAFYDASHAHFKTYGDNYWADVALYQASITYAREGEYARAREGIEPTLPYLRQHKHRDMIALKLSTLGDIARSEDNYTLAKQFYTEGIETARDIGLREVMTNMIQSMGYVALHDREPEMARTYFAEYFQLAQDFQKESMKNFSMLQLASLSAAENKARQAVILFAYGKIFFETKGKNYLDAIDETEVERYLALAREQLSEQEFSAAWEEGRGLTLEQAIELAMETANG